MSEEAFYIELGRRLRYVRQATDLNQGELARRVGLSRTSIVNIEQGRQCPPLYTIARMCWLMGYELGALVATPWTPPPPKPRRDRGQHVVGNRGVPLPA